MNEPFKKFDQQLDRLFDRQREDKVTADDIADLERQLHADPALRRRYRSRVMMEEELSATFEKPAELVLPFDMEHESRPWYQRAPIALAGIAAVIIAVVAIISIFDNQEADLDSKTVASLEDRSADLWEGTLNLHDDSRVAPGEFRLESGTARFRFDSGAEVTLEGPAALVIENAMRVRLQHGKALVEAPKSARGFVMSVPHGEAVDLGTKFSVTVEDGTVTCEVLEGRVLMRHASSEREEYLDGGQVITMDKNAMTSLTYRPSMSFAPKDGQVVLLKSTAEATVVSSNLRTGRVDDRMLLVKMEPDSTMKRRALFNIGLNQIEKRTIESAKLNLNLVPSGLGFASYLPETITFAIYGISDESLEDWNSKAPLWEDAPGYVAGNEDTLNSADLALLGKFSINRGQQRGRCTLETEALRTFLSADTTGTAGFLIVRETYGGGDYSLVHAFASSLHPEASGPSLEVVLGARE